jgi:hypothetical protein
MRMLYLVIESYDHRHRSNINCMHEFLVYAPGPWSCLSAYIYIRSGAVRYPGDATYFPERGGESYWKLARSGVATIRSRRSHRHSHQKEGGTWALTSEISVRFPSTRLARTTYDQQRRHKKRDRGKPRLLIHHGRVSLVFITSRHIGGELTTPPYTRYTYIYCSQVKVNDDGALQHLLYEATSRKNTRRCPCIHMPHLVVASCRTLLEPFPQQWARNQRGTTRTTSPQTIQTLLYIFLSIAKNTR